MTFVVKAGSELPDRTPSGARRKYPFDTLVVDGVFFVPNRTCKQLTSYVSLMGRNLTKVRGTPVKFSSQRATMRRDEAGAWVPCEPEADGATPGVAVRRTA